MDHTHSRRASVVIIGAGGHGKVVCDALIASGHRITGWLDDAPGLAGVRVAGIPVLGPSRDARRILRRMRGGRPCFIVAIGDNRQRTAIFDSLVDAGFAFVSAIHPRSIVAPSASVGRGVMICAGAVVNPDVVIEDNAIINTCASVDHDSVVGCGAHLSPGAHTGGFVRIGCGAHLGLGAVVLPKVTVGDWSVVGAGAVVSRNVPARVVAAGVPARIIRASTR